MRSRTHSHSTHWTYTHTHTHTEEKRCGWSAQMYENIRRTASGRPEVAVMSKEEHKLNRAGSCVWPLDDEHKVVFYENKRIRKSQVLLKSFKKTKSSGDGGGGFTLTMWKINKLVVTVITFWKNYWNNFGKQAKMTLRLDVNLVWCLAFGRQDPIGWEREKRERCKNKS